MNKKEQIEKIINTTLERYEFELLKDEYSVIADELAQKIVKLFAIPDVSKSVCDNCGHPFTDDVCCAKCQDKKID